ncbi:response regulator [bacterium]|nr:response regulator [bacterium]
MNKNAKRAKILIVDDDEVIQFMLKHILETKYDVQCEQDGEEVLLAIKSFHPDIILLDVMLPGMDGYELCALVKKDPKLKFIKIILLSGNCDLQYRLKGYRAGADDYLSKPFDKDELEAKMAIFLRLKIGEEVDLARESLISLISHETRTPLNTILGCADLLSDSLANESDLELVEYIIKAGKQLLKFADNTSLLCRLRTGYDFSFIEIHASELLSLCLQKYPEQRYHYNVKQDYLLQADLSLLVIAIHSIIDNAFDYGPDDEYVTIDIDILNGQNVLSISDRGPGIPQHKVDDIFAGLTTVNIDHHDKGQCLSLSISNEIFIGHDAQLNIRETIPNGATLEILWKQNQKKSKQ